MTLTDSRSEQTEYLLVVQAPCYRVDEHTFATESAFAEHLRVLKRKLAPRFDRLWIAAPQSTEDFYRANRGHLGHVDEQHEQIFYVPLNHTNVTTLGFWTQEAPAVWRALRQRTKRSRIVHGGLASDVFRPSLLLANLAARLDGCKTLFVVDIDFRRDAWRMWKSGQWSLRSYVACSLVYDPIRLAQMWIATYMSSLLLLKGASLVRDFGRGRQNVRNFWDTAHSSEQIIDDHALEARLKRLEDRTRPISLIYFGRLVPNKGIERMIRSVWKARDLSGRPFTLDLIGTGDDLPRLRACVEALGAGEAIRFNEPLPYGPRLFAKVREADLMLATPLIEDTPRSAFDAMASGLPVLGFDIDYYRSLANETQAVETSPWPEVDAFAERIVALDADRARLDGMSRAAVRFARANTQEIWIDRRIEWTFSLLDVSGT